MRQWRTKVEPKPAEPGPGAEQLPGVTPEMRLGPAEESRAPRRGDKAKGGRRRRMRASTLLSMVSALVGVAALAASGWVYSQTHREVLRLATDVAQLRISLDLYAQRSGAAPTAASGGPTSAELSDLSNRLSIIEQNMRGGAVAPSVPSLPAITGGAETSEGDGDCLPPGMRILVASGDSYDICGTTGSITVSAVDNGYLTLSDGNIIASGGTLPLAGTNCMLGVTSGGDEGLTGFAEIRVSC
jgi:hypothetical protein